MPTGNSLNLTKEIYLNQLSLSTAFQEIIRIKIKSTRSDKQISRSRRGPSTSNDEGMRTASTMSVTVMTHNALKLTGALPTAPELGVWAKILGLLRNFVKNHIPEGYQDQNGFHFGLKQPE